MRCNRCAGELIMPATAIGIPAFQWAAGCLVRPSDFASAVGYPDNIARFQRFKQGQDVWNEDE